VLHVPLLRLCLLLCSVICLISEPYVRILAYIVQTLFFVAMFSVCPSCNFSLGVLLVFDIIDILECFSKLLF
jgi:hypothetical protein